MRVCLYVPCRDGAAFLPALVAAVASQTRAPDVLLLVDDQSIDGSGDIARQSGWLVAATTKQRSGLSAARNRALEIAVETGCDILAGLDADAIPAADYVETLARFFQSRADVAGVCGNMQERFHESPSDLWRAVHMRQHWGSEPLENPPILYGSSAAHRVGPIRDLGGFNEALRTNFEDTDLTQRLLGARHRLAYLPSLRLEHLKRDTPDSVLRMFWNWYLPPAVLAGRFDSADAWLQGRHAWIWSDYRSRARIDEAVPQLGLLTLALPWVQVVRDLDMLSERLGEPADTSPLADLAAKVLTDRGQDAALAAWVAERVRNAGRQSAAPSRSPLNPAILRLVAAESINAIPHRAYWSLVERGGRAHGVPSA